MKDIIILEKLREKKLSKGPADTIAIVEVARTLSLNELTCRYRWRISNVEKDAAKKLRLTRVKEY